jgi:hypothetical protein
MSKSKTGRMAKDIFAPTTQDEPVAQESEELEDESELLAPVKPAVNPPKRAQNKPEPVTAKELMEQEARRMPGRPIVHDEPWRKITLVTFDRQIAQLDEIRVGIRRKTGAAVKRAEIYRAAVDALIETGVDLTGARSEDDLKSIISRRLSR